MTNSSSSRKGLHAATPCVRALIGLCLTVLVAQAQDRPRAILPGFRGAVYMDTIGTVRAVAARPLTILAALDTAMRELGVEAQTDAAHHLVGNMLIKTQRRLGKVPLSRYLDCGLRERGPNADFYRVHLAVVGQATPRGADSTDLRLAVAAGAQDFAGPLADPVSCTSTGLLEERLMDLVRTRIAR